MTSTSKANNNIGAISALKGYRVQFLYSLLRILSSSSEEAKFFLEGEFEDLDIHDSTGKVLEIIQVKNLGDTLTLSNILSKKESSFIRRAILAHQRGHKPEVKLVSFGEVNCDIEELSKENFSANFKTKLKKSDLKDSDITFLQDSFSYEIVKEGNVEKLVLEKIRERKIFSDSKIALSLLIYWMYTAAEQQIAIERSDLIDKLNCISKYQSERESFHKLIGTLIRPLDREVDTENQETLKSDFYRGISATYKHIVAGVDIVRPEKLKSIKDRFSESNIVFIHGASGQGKSTLAYRYLHEYCGDSSVYELKLSSDHTLVYEIMNSLEGIAKGIGFPLTLYIDVVPGDNGWIRLLEELSTKREFNFLITVREEDWNSITVGDRFQFSEVELLFQKDEAELVYDGLSQYQQDLRFVDFENAWTTFGGEGPLLEFVYLITQKESLPAKLKSQIAKIRDDASSQGKEKIKLLRHIALADCFGAKIKYKDIALQLKIEDISRITELLEKEYLIKSVEAKSYITGLHPVRSEIIRKLLFDNEIHPESDYILNSLSSVSEDTVLNYLRNGFKKSCLNPNQLLDELKKIVPNSWQFYQQMFKALLWKGIDDYVRDNKATLDQIHVDYGEAWALVVDFNFVNMLGEGELIKNSDLVTQQQKQYAENVNRQLDDKKVVLKYCNQWIESIQRVDVIPNDSMEWDSFGSFLFWLDYLGANNVEIPFRSFPLKKAFENQPLDILSRVLYAIKVFSELSKSHVDAVEPIFLRRLSEELNIVFIEKHQKVLRCHYLFDIINEKGEKGESEIVHAKSMKIIDLLRLAFPDKESYSTKGYGHQFSFLPDAHDSSVKEISGNNLPLKPLIEINSGYRNLYNHSHRPSTWQMFVDHIVERRLLFVEILKKLNSAFQKHYKDESYQPLLDYFQDYTSNCEGAVKDDSMPMLPQTIIDEWGDYSEGSTKTIQSDRQNDKEKKQVLAVKKYENFLSLRRDYSSSLENFIWQSASTIAKRIKDQLGQDSSNIRDNSRISLAGNLFKVYECLSDFQRSFRTHFEKFSDSDELQRIERDEFEQISALCFTYRQFINCHPFKANNHFKIAINRLKETKISVQNRMTSALKTLGKNHGINLRVEFLDEQRRCLVFLEAPSSIEGLQMLENVYNALYKAVDCPDSTSIKRLIIDTYYPVFNVILLIKGNTLNGKWYEFKSYNLVDKEFSELAQFNLIPQDIPAEITEKYSIGSWNKYLPEFNDLDKMLKDVSILPQLAFHFAQLKQLENLASESYGEKVLQDHVTKTGRVFQDSLEQGLASFTHYAKQTFAKEIDFDNDSERSVIYELIDSSCKNFYLSDELYEQGSFTTTLTMEQMEEWLPRLEELKNQIAFIYFILADNVTAESGLNY